jgi:flagellar assembly factor FliW
MTVTTKPFGTIDVDERQRIAFPNGLLGFENLKAFVLLDASQPPFYWLQSLDEEDIAFVLIDPAVFRPDYNADAAPEDLEEIGIRSDEDMLVFSVVTIPEQQEQMTANLQGPIIINKKTKHARQIISPNPRWKVRHFILEELAAVKDRAC